MSPTPLSRTLSALARGAAGVILLAVLVAVSAFGVSLTTGTADARPAGAATKSVPTYWLAAADGGVFAFGGAPFYGSMGGTYLYRPIVGLAAGPKDAGYWEVASDGGVFSFGSAGFHGSTGGQALNQPVVGMSGTPNGAGYWLVAADGGVFAYGNAGFYGSTGNIHLNRPIVGMASTSDGRGYWLVAADGGVFAFGDARFFGSTGNLTLAKPIVAMAPTANHQGYWLVAADGGVFAFGNAGFYGSLGGEPQHFPVVAMAPSGDGAGYWFTNSNGAVTAFGDATYWGSTPQYLAAPVVAMARAVGNGVFAASSYPSGSTGYDISNFQCGDYPPAPHTIGIVQVEGASFGATNPCLASEAAWSGGGLNLYAFLTYGLATGSADAACAGSQSCNYGYNAGIDAFDKAVAAGINAAVPWWLDVESYSINGVASWPGNDPQASAQLVQGYLDALHSEGLNSVGIYASPGVWPGIVGSYQPAVPYWVADYGPPPATTCVDVHDLWPGLPTGPVQIVQYGSGQFDEDYAC